MFPRLQGGVGCLFQHYILGESAWTRRQISTCRSGSRRTRSKCRDFNAAFASIDAALKAEGDARSEADGTAAERITALAQTIANGKICRIKYGSYTGNGKYGAANAVSIECGFYPLLVMVSSSSSSHYWAVRGFDKFYYSNNRENEMTWGDTGVSWYYPQDDQYYPPSGNQMNAIDTTYYYLVLGYSNDGEQGI